MRWAKIPRSWLCSQKRRITRLAVDKFLEVRIGMWGWLGSVLSGRRVVSSPRTERRLSTTSRMQATRGIRYQHLSLWWSCVGRGCTYSSMLLAAADYNVHSWWGRTWNMPEDLKLHGSHLLHWWNTCQCEVASKSEGRVLTQALAYLQGRLGLLEDLTLGDGTWWSRGLSWRSEMECDLVFILRRITEKIAVLLM